VRQAAICRTWDGVFVPSEHVATDVRHHGVGRRLVVVAEGTDHLDALMATAPDGTRDQLLVLGGAAAHKRTPLAVEAAAAAAVQLGCRVSVVGAAPGIVRGVGVDRHEEHPTDADLAGLLSAARVAITGTAYEGFGLAVGEALRAGVPVVWCADSPLGSIVGDGGMAAAPTAASLTAAVVDAWGRADDLARGARAATSSLTWSRTAQAIVATIESDRDRRSDAGPRG
jgi:glycosyltransferase involved in cell wall biosynthesis